jgi:hypothetical protein
MEDTNQPQAKLHRAQFGTTHPVIVTEQLADPVELVFQAFLRLAPEQRARLIQRLKGRVRSSSRGAFGWLTGSERQRGSGNDERRVAKQERRPTEQNQ